MRRTVRALLEHPALPYGLALLAVLLALPALGVGLQFDDYLHREALRGAASPAGAAWSLFTFLDGDPAQAQRLMDSGAFPWWTLPTAREAFWRPLAALTHWLDYRLWPDQPAAMHAHSLLWFGALVAATGALYRRSAPSAGVAGLAALLYAVDDAHGFAAGWLANRNGLLAALFGVLCLQAYVRWRGERWKAGAVLAPLWLALGLLSAEAAVGALAYMAAYALCLDRAPWRDRLLALMPSALVVAAWAIAYRAFGYGAWGTAYVDPLQEPLAFARAALERAPVLVLAQWAGPPAELYPFLGPLPRLALWLAAGGAMVLLAWLFVPVIKHSRTARFWVVGMGLALLPICAALPANRLLFFVGLGAMGLLAEAVSGAVILGPRYVTAPTPPLRCAAGGRRGRRYKVLSFRPSSVVLLSLHLVLASLLLPLTAYSPKLLGNLEPAALSVSANAADTMILLNAPSFFSASMLGPIRTAHSLTVPARVRYLGAGPAALELRRPDAQTLVVRPAGGYLTGFDTVFRGRHHPLALGETVTMEGLSVEVLALTADGRPAEVAFRFAMPLEDAGLRWYAWRGGVFVPFGLPAVGETLNVPPLELLGSL